MNGECGRCKTMIENYFRINWNLLYVKIEKICRIEKKLNEEFYMFYLCNRTLFYCFQKDIIIPHRHTNTRRKITSTQSNIYCIYRIVLINDVD